MQKRNSLNIYNLETLHIHLSRNCNLACANCWIGSKPKIESFVMPINKIKQIINEAETLGVKFVKLTGGEPFLYENFNDILDFLVVKKLHISIETNATIPFELHLPLFTSLKDRIEFTISMDGYDQESNMLQRGGDFNIIKKNIQQLVKNNIQTGVITLVTNNNFKYIDKIIKVVRDLNVHSHRLILNLNPSGRAKQHLKSSISIEATFKLVEYIKKYDFYDESRQTTPHLYTTLPAAFQVTKSKFFNTCFWGINLCTILSNLNVAICGSGYTNPKLLAGNLNESSLVDIWNNSIVFNNIRSHEKHNLKGVCSNCIFVIKCRGLCRAQAVAVYDDIFAPYPFCQEAYNSGYFPNQYLIDPTLNSKY